jgi:uncharacterized protein (TIGR00369 family)
MQSFLETSFPQTACIVEAINDDEATLRYPVGFSELRPGGTVSGPVMFALADCALYVALLAKIGIVPLAVTTNLSINFMRKPAADRDLLGTCKMLKVGKSLAVGEVSIRSEGSQDIVAHATGTYAIPPAR